MRRLLSRCFTLDLRSLAAARICLSLVLLADLLIRLTVLEDFHTDSGFMPRAELVRFKYVPSSICLHLFSGATWLMAVLFLFHIACVIALSLGYRTQLVTALCWLMGNSLQTRNPFILDSGDRLLMLILIWGFFCDWGKFYSLDARKNGVPGDTQVCHVGTAGFVLQMVYLYWFSVFYKWHPVWFSEGTALYIALNLELFCRPLAKSVLPFWDLMKTSTHLTVFAEAIGPLLILTGQKWLRLSGVLLLSVLHLGIFALMSIGVFALVSLTYLVAFIPGFVWDKFQKGQADKVAVPESSERSFWKELTAAILLTLVTWWNVNRAFSVPMPLPVFNLCHALKVDQYWNLFAPVPRTLDCWFVLYGVTESGKELDLWMPEAKPLSWEKPESVEATFRCHRDRVFGTALEYVLEEGGRQSYLAVKARQHNEKHPDDPVVHLKFYRVEQLTALGYKYVKPEPVMLFERTVGVSDDKS